MSDRSDDEKVAQDVFSEITEGKKSFWTTAYPTYMNRDMTRGQMRELVSIALRETGGCYKRVVEILNMPPGDYKRFMNFVTQHGVKLPFRDFRPSALLKAS
ncbi:MAG: hypothetical protein A3I07_00930 [Candidatus Doudnabacteria bacterium RIFCSPLOWO2_02_FULL_42_9]|nr:MAG: hypothetical protein A3I07_00930 [Candidatus Doudnabacteria bacterium RIFCSPLOWO2_02_FULL_42_9]